MTPHPESNHDPRIDRATGDGPVFEGPPTPEEVAATALHRVMVPIEAMPEEVRLRLMGSVGVGRSPVRKAGPWRFVPWLAAAAGIGAAVFIGISANQQAQLRGRDLAASREATRQAEARLAAAESSAREALAAVQTEADSRLAQATQREQQLSQELEAAKLTIARYQEPVDPAVLQGDRRKLLSAPGTIRVAWAPFEVPNAAPAEQAGVQGDVVWNDTIKSGYLRFVGLKVNDPKVEQYQVWVIDERGMEQKVSGGVFNATAEGEVIVPIHPGIEVGRVALFAITIEKPGGTWVPDLKRRVVVAPRGEG